MKKLSILTKIFLILIVFFLGVGASYFYLVKVRPIKEVVPEEKNIYLSFLTEIYEKIQENYWEKITDEQLTDLFLRATEKLTGQPQVLDANDKVSLEKHLADLLGQIETEEKKKEFSVKLAEIVLANLLPLGRSQLYTQKEEKELKNLVENVNPETGKIEPIIDSKLIRPTIFYLRLKKFSPTSLEELKSVTEKVDTQQGLDTLILDLRDNVGGSIDLLPYFLGPFIGQDQYVYQFLHQGKKTDFKTRTGWLPSLVRYKKVVILINENTQSSAEVVAATLKRYNVGVLVGTKSRGWGTVEKVFQMENQIDPSEKHSIFLAHSLTLRDDGQVIEGKGVEPLINITDPNWETQLYAYFHYQELIEAVKEILTPPSTSQD